MKKWVGLAVKGEANNSVLLDYVGMIVSMKKKIRIIKLKEEKCAFNVYSSRHTYT